MRIFCILVFFGLLIPRFAGAAVFSLNAERVEFVQGEKFEVFLFLDTEQESINAFEGIVSFPQDVLEVSEVLSSSSLVSFWLEEPSLVAPGAISFSGIVPGGYAGHDGYLFSVVFLAQQKGQATIAMNGAKALKHDGKGTAAPMRFSDAKLIIAPGTVNLQQEQPEKDTEKPETFMPAIAHDSAIFDGKYFVVFTAQDKGSGIDYYEIKETRFRLLEPLTKWIRVESPALLQDQELSSYVYIKATDRAGNSRVESVEPFNPIPWQNNPEHWILTAGIGILSHRIYKIFQKRFKKK